MSDVLTLEKASRILREATKDKSFLDTPLGRDVQAYLRVKRKRLTASSEDLYEGSLHKFVLAFAGMRIEDFEPPVGAELVEGFLDQRFQQLSPRTYNVHHAILKDFFLFFRQRGRLKGDPMLLIERAREDQAHRSAYTRDQVRAIIASQSELRDRICVRLMLHYGFRQGSMRKIQFKHFDYSRKKLTIFAKGGKVRNVGIPEPEFWTDLERHILEIEAQPDYFLMCSAKGRLHWRVELHEKPMSNATFHYWWYDRLIAAGICEPGTSKGEKPHKARHTSGQLVLDVTGNLKLVQKHLGHANIATTGNTYTDYDDDALMTILGEHVFKGDDDEQSR